MATSEGIERSLTEISWKLAIGERQIVDNAVRSPVHSFNALHTATNSAKADEHLYLPCRGDLREDRPKQIGWNVEQFAQPALVAGMDFPVRPLGHVFIRRHDRVASARGHNESDYIPVFERR